MLTEGSGATQSIKGRTIEKSVGKEDGQKKTGGWAREVLDCWLRLIRKQ